MLFCEKLIKPRIEIKQFLAHLLVLKNSDFFGSLLDGNNLVESYIIANLFWSWQMILIGDPLYRPFKNFPARKLSGIHPSLK